MGVTGLWNMVRPIMIEESLSTVSLEDDRKVYRIGVDASIWINQLQRSLVHTHAQIGENPELKNLFYRLAMLSERPLDLLFVFDGPRRPVMKRGRKVKMAPHWLVDLTRQFVVAFGYQCHQAPGEAEAELAHLNTTRIIDAVMTEDGDALLFGAGTVIRNPSFKRNAPDAVEVYRMSAITSSLGLTKEDLILFGLLCGSDYDQIGLTGCGGVTARGVIRYGLGKDLHHAMRSMDRPELGGYLQGWRSRLHEILMEDPEGFIGHRNPRLASRITPEFPDLDVLTLYVHPVKSKDMPSPPGPHRLDIERLGQLCELHFSWGNRAELARRFRISIWPGEVVRTLMQESISKGTGAEQPSRRLRFEMEATPRNAAHEVVITDESFTCTVLESLRNVRAFRKTGDEDEDAVLKKAKEPMKMKLSSLFIERFLPGLLASKAIAPSSSTVNCEWEQTEMQTAPVRSLSPTTKSDASSTPSGFDEPWVSPVANDSPGRRTVDQARPWKRNFKLIDDEDIIDLTAEEDEGGLIDHDSIIDLTADEEEDNRPAKKARRMSDSESVIEISDDEI